MRFCTSILLSFCLLPCLAVAQPEQPSAGQNSEYADNALRIQYSLFGTKIVQGVDDKKIAGMDWFASDVDFLSQRDDEIGGTFRSYRKKKQISGLMYVASIATMMAAIITNDEFGDDDSESFFWGSMGLLSIGAATQVSANESLSQSLWMYNSTLDTRGR